MDFKNYMLAVLEGVLIIGLFLMIFRDKHLSLKTEYSVMNDINRYEAVDIPRVLSPDANVDVVYYFTTMNRDYTCRKIEAFTRDVLNKNFSPEFVDGLIVWRMIMVDIPVYRHFIDDFQLHERSVVLVKIRGGKRIIWKKLDEMRLFIRDKSLYNQYITVEVKSFLKGRLDGYVLETDRDDTLAGSPYIQRTEFPVSTRHEDFSPLNVPGRVCSWNRKSYANDVRAPDAFRLLNGYAHPEKNKNTFPLYRKFMSEPDG